MRLRAILLELVSRRDNIRGEKSKCACGRYFLNLLAVFIKRRYTHYGISNVLSKSFK